MRRVLKSMGLEPKTTTTLEGLPDELLTLYNINPVSCRKQENTWSIESERDSYLASEYRGDTEKLEIALNWQEYLTNRGFTGVPRLIKGNQGQSYVKLGGKTFCIEASPPKDEFNGSISEHLLLAAEGLGEMHELSKEYSINAAVKGVNKGWSKIYQERLTELLTFFCLLRQERARNDFERLYAENFDFLYTQGQEALQKMILARYGMGGAEQKEIMLVNSFRHRRLAVCDKRVLFLNIREWDTGSNVDDLALFINSYLPLHRWDRGLLRKILEKYSQNCPLNDCENTVLLGQLRFPNRYWFYTYQYINSLKSVSELAYLLKSYVNECCLRDSCLDSMDNWL